MHPAECWVTPPEMGAGTGLAWLPACVLCQESPQPVQRAAHYPLTRARHALGLTLLVSPLLQATSPAISSPLLAASTPAELNTSSALKAFIDGRSPATPGASYARGTLGVMTVGQSQPRQLASCPHGPALGCAVLSEGYMSRSTLYCCWPPPGGLGRNVLHATWQMVCAAHSLSVWWPAKHSAAGFPPTGLNALSGTAVFRRLLPVCLPLTP